MDPIVFKVIQYNKKGVGTGRRIMRYITIFIVIIFILGIISEKTDGFLFPKKIIESNVFYIFIFLCLLTIWFAAFKIGYHQNIRETIGKIELDEEEAIIVVNSERHLFNHKEYLIKFVDNGYEGQSNWVPGTSIGAASFESGINEIEFIYLKDWSKRYKYEIVIENSRRMKHLLNLLKKIEEDNS